MFNAKGQPWVGVDVVAIVYTLDEGVNHDAIFDVIAKIDMDFDTSCKDDCEISWASYNEKECRIEFRPEDCGASHYRFPADQDMIKLLVNKMATAGMRVDDVTLHFNY